MDDVIPNGTYVESSIHIHKDVIVKRGVVVKYRPRSNLYLVKLDTPIVSDNGRCLGIVYAIAKFTRRISQ